VEPAWLDVAAAARYCSCSVPTIRRAIRAGTLRHVRVGRVLRTKREWCDLWLECGGRTAADNDADANTRVEISPDPTWSVESRSH
jgi:excisionase family DNA binding protein